MPRPPRQGRRSWLRRRRSRRRRLRFTRDGKYYVAITIGIGLAAINTGNNLLYLLFGWLLSMIMASGILSELTLKRLTVRRRPPAQVFAQRPFLTEISVTNDKQRIATYSIEVEDLEGGRPIDKKCFFLKIPPGRVQKTSYRHTFHRRGLYTFSGFRVATRFPFSLFTKSRDVEDESQVLVFPAIHDLPAPAPRASRQGETAATRIGRAGEFFGLREYREGDDRRAIHWRSSARGNRLLVREYEEESERRTTLVVDNALPAGAGPEARDALEDAISLAASLARSYSLAGFAVRLIGRGALVPFAAGPAQLTRILRTLALMDTVPPETGWSGAVEPRGDSLLVVPRVPGFAPDDRPARVTQILEAGGAP